MNEEPSPLAHEVLAWTMDHQRNRTRGSAKALFELVQHVLSDAAEARGAAPELVDACSALADDPCGLDSTGLRAVCVDVAMRELAAGRRVPAEALDGLALDPRASCRARRQGARDTGRSGLRSALPTRTPARIAPRTSTRSSSGAA